MTDLHELVLLQWSMEHYFYSWIVFESSEFPLIIFSLQFVTFIEIPKYKLKYYKDTYCTLNSVYIIYSNKLISNK